jgi:IclR family KDG regulon transcriptional repressor
MYVNGVAVADGVKSAERAVALLELLASEPDGLPFGEICAVLELPKSSAHALLSTLVKANFLRFEPTMRRYYVGVRAFEVGQAFIHGLDVAREAVPHLQSLREAVNETAQLAILEGVENVYVAKVEASHHLKLASDVGLRLPAHATALGKVLLSGLSDDEVKARFSGRPLEHFTDKTITTVEGLLDQLSQVRLLGFSLDEGEHTPGVYCTAVPIRDHRETVIAAMSVSVPVVRNSPEARLNILESLRREAGRLSNRLGCPGEAA